MLKEIPWLFSSSCAYAYWGHIRVHIFTHSHPKMRPAIQLDYAKVYYQMDSKQSGDENDIQGHRDNIQTCAHAYLGNLKKIFIYLLIYRVIGKKWLLHMQEFFFLILV